MNTQILPGRVVDSVTVDASTKVTKNLVGQKILSYQTRMGYIPYLAFVGDAWSSALDSHLTKRVLVDGGSLWDYQDSTIQWAPPETAGYNEKSNWLPIQEGATITYQADVDNDSSLTGGVGGAGTVFARFTIKYVAKERRL